jgi:hypothetical protein
LIGSRVETRPGAFKLRGNCIHNLYSPAEAAEASALAPAAAAAADADGDLVVVGLALGLAVVPPAV